MNGPEPLRPHFLDTSALVKLVVSEPGSDTLRNFFHSVSWFATSPLCIAEALGVLKRKWASGELTDRQYHTGAWELLWSYREGGCIQLVHEHLGSTEAFTAAKALSNTYRLDLADALQVHHLLSGSLAAFCQGSQAVLVSADAALIKAARSEGLLGWEFIHEASPP
jgi:hypothetical protein